VESLGICLSNLPAMLPSWLTRKITTITVSPRGSIVIIPAKKNDPIPFLRDVLFFTYKLPKPNTLLHKTEEQTLTKGIFSP